MATFNDLVMAGVRGNGLTADEAAEIAGVSPHTFYRHRTGKAKKAITAEDSICKLVDQGIVDPLALPAYCRERCQIGQKREKLNLKRERPRYVNRSHMMKLLKKFYLKFS
mgnify:CR=1 FL=1|jgi:DNA-binding XRE family transcriptional regulator